VKDPRRFRHDISQLRADGSQDGNGLRVLQHEAKTLCRRPGIHRQVRRAGQQDRQHGDEQLRARLRANADDLLRADSPLKQLVCDVLGSRG
jgi:hypothetical protein